MNDREKPPNGTKGPDWIDVEAGLWPIPPNSPDPMTPAERHWLDHPEERECRSPRMLGWCLVILAVVGVALAVAILR